MTIKKSRAFTLIVSCAQHTAQAAYADADAAIARITALAEAEQSALDAKYPPQPEDPPKEGCCGDNS